MMNKKGEVSSESLVGWGIALLVFVVVILIFVLNIGGIRDKIFGFAGGSSNLDSRVIACNLDCTQLNKNNFCSLKRDLDNGNGYKGSYTCNELGSEMVLKKGSEETKVSLGISCSKITC